ncbi:hypothetical protein EV363DRAFT_1458523 [Boletus edulis]|uniref:Oxidase ustYa n=1 Tax=Boletus edulis BED1 TaxID=1328754 RepID=A0AAD4BQ73_BOLED|nr:hypothetical protein EV363DRAFT_1459934 [Boletus edulis]KAF8120923.1 hypothetical protein EV363DRAFT_1458523 [Boletus edulis]KAF8436501.1 hypothetical protein L210DRAFT_3647831 [Boletus edulis BED1]
MDTPRRPASISWELALWSTIAILLAIWSASIVRKPPGDTVDLTEERTSDTDYSWVGDDYPAYYPMEVRDVIMFPEDTVHYPINGDDALQQWKTQFPTIGEGWVCLGPERRPFALTMYHELHCLERIRLALEDSANRTYEARAEHVQHCLNYLRMMTLCRADVTLEPVIDASLAVDLAQPHLCRDWVQVYEEATRNAERCRKYGT